MHRGRMSVHESQSPGNSGARKSVTKCKSHFRCRIQPRLVVTPNGAIFPLCRRKQIGSQTPIARCMVHNERKIQQLKSVTRSVQNKDVSHHFPAAWCKNKTTQPLSKRRDNSGEFHLEERKQTAGCDQRRSVELVTNDGTDHEIFMLDTSDYPWCKINQSPLQRHGANQ